MNGTLDMEKTVSQLYSNPSLYHHLVKLREDNERTLQVCEELYKEALDKDDTDTKKRRPGETPRLGEHESWDRIYSMWNNFNVSDYYDEVRRENADNQRLNEEQQQENESQRTKRSTTKRPPSEWQPRITIPEPFSMSVRQEPRKICQQRHQEEAVEREKQASRRRPFRAQPPPAHIYLPIYDELTEQQQLKSQMRKEIRAEILTSKVEPFNFTLREEEKKRMANLQALYARRRMEAERRQRADSARSAKFKARPVPAHLFDENLDEALQENEEYRQIRIKMRAMDQLEKSELPPRMMKAKLEDEKKRLDKLIDLQRQKEQKLLKKKKRPKSSELSFRQLEQQPFDSSAVDESLNVLTNDYRDGIVDVLADDVGLAPVATTAKPFRFATQQRAEIKRMKIEAEEEEKRRRSEQRGLHTQRKSGRYIGSPLWQSHDFSLVLPHATNAQEVRLQRHTKALLGDREIQRRSSEVEKLRRRQRERQLRQVVLDRARYDELELERRHKLWERTERARDENRRRHKAYQSELRGIERRVRERPLLLERQSHEGAQQRVERRYQDTLKRFGLSEETLREQANAVISDDDEHGDHPDYHDYHDYGGSGESPLVDEHLTAAEGLPVKDDEFNMNVTFTKDSDDNFDGDDDDEVVEEVVDEFADEFVEDDQT